MIGKKGKLFYYKDLFKKKDRDKASVTRGVIDRLSRDFQEKMGYPPEEIVARRDEVSKSAKGLVTEVVKSIPPGHVIIYPVIVRQARIYNSERKPR